MRAATKARMMTERMIRIIAEAGLAGGLSANRKLSRNRLRGSIGLGFRPVVRRTGSSVYILS